VLKDEVHYEDEKSYDDRSNHNDSGAGEEIAPGRPSRLDDELIIDVLAVVNDFVH